MEEKSPELEEIAALENAMKMSDLEFEEPKTDSTESVESSYCNVPELKERPALNKVEWKRTIDEDFMDLEERILRGAVELEEALDIIESKKRKESETFKLEENNTISRRIEDEIAYTQANEKSFWESQDRILKKTLELEEASQKRKESAALKLKETNSAPGPNEDEIPYTQANEKSFWESQDRILRKTLELEEALQKRKESAALKLKERNSAPGTNEDEIAFRRANEKSVLESQDTILRKVLALEESFEKSKKSEALKVLERNSVARRGLDAEDGINDRHAETQIPLMEEESVSIDLGDGSENSNIDQVQINTNKKADLKKIFRSLSFEDRSSSISSTIHQIRNAKKSSTSAFDCCKKTIVLIASSLLYIIYVAGISIVSIAMLVIGSTYLEQCTVQPYIPIYLVVAGAWGTFYNFIAISRNYFCGKPATIGYYDGAVNLFLLIWYILGCVWVYGVSHVEFYDTSNPEYCHKTVYYFAFWFFNCIFILLGLSVLLCICALCCAPFL